MWRPGFAFEERSGAIMHGVHRRLCIYSHVHRGTPDKPGMVLGLDRGGSCRGIGYRVAGNRRDETIAYLREREQVTMIYKERWRDMLVDRDGPSHQVNALVYLVDQDHVQYAGKKISSKTCCRLSCRATARAVRALTIYASTLDHIEELGFKDSHLSEVLTLARNHRA